METRMTKAAPAAPFVGTKNDLPVSVREEMARLLNQCLADAIDLQLQCKQAHWNVKGMRFYTLHKLFDDVHGAVVGYVDTLAERAAQLGGRVLATVREVEAATRLKDYPDSAVAGEVHLEALSSALADFGKGVREAIEDATEAGDAGTADVFTEISRGTDQWLWFVESHLHGDH